MICKVWSYWQATVVCNAGYHLAISKHPFDPSSSNPSQLFLVPAHRRAPPPAHKGASPILSGSHAWGASARNSRYRLGPSAAPSNYLKPHRRIPPPSYQSTPGRVGSSGQTDGTGRAAGTTTNGGVPGQSITGSEPQENYDEPEDVESVGPSGAAVPGSASGKASGAPSREPSSQGDRGRSNKGKGERVRGTGGNATDQRYKDRGTGGNVTDEQYQAGWQGEDEDTGIESSFPEENQQRSVGNTTQCQSDRLFHPPLVCLPDLCNSRPPPEHGYVLPPGAVPVGQRVSLGCDPGYVLWGDDHVLENIGRPTDPDPAGPADLWTNDMWLARPLCLPDRHFTPGAVCVPWCGAHPPVEHATVTSHQPSI